MTNAEKMIRQDIKDLDAYRLAYRKKDIENDLKYAYWHGFISEYIYKKLGQQVSDKYNEVCSKICNENYS
jgi:hypothetical protein